MKTPDEIKKGLVEAIAVTFWVVKDGDDHDLKDACDVAHTSMTAAMIYIQHLEAERDALFKEVRGRCSTCKNFDKEVEEEPCSCCVVFDGNNLNWEWRGVQKEE